MNGPDHYRTAEEMKQKAKQAGQDKDGASVVVYMTSAQFHATMSLAAAVAATIPGVHGQPQEWNKALASSPGRERAVKCRWPSCLTKEQEQLLVEEITQESETGEPCHIYLDKYPQDQRQVCGCKEGKP